MPGLEIDIVPLTLTLHDDDIRACAALINRRQQFEPNRLRDVTRSEEDRLQANVKRLRTHLRDPQTSAYVARRKGTDEVLGWISWLRPEDTLNGTRKATSDQATHVNDAIDTGSESDYERDYEAVKAVANEKKVQQKRIFGDQPFW